LSVGGAGDVGSAKPDLVVELRVSRARGKVRVEGLVRDAEVGQQAAHVVAKPVPLSDLDQAAAELVRALVRPIGDAVVLRTQRQCDEKAAVKSPPAPVSPSPEARKPDMRPAVLVLQPEGKVAGGAVEFRDVTIGATARLLDGLGYRTILGGKTGFISPSD